MLWGTLCQPVWHYAMRTSMPTWRLLCYEDLYVNETDAMIWGSISALYSFFLFSLKLTSTIYERGDTSWQRWRTWGMSLRCDSIRHLSGLSFWGNEDGISLYYLLNHLSQQASQDVTLPGKRDGCSTDLRLVRELFPLLNIARGMVAKSISSMLDEFSSLSFSSCEELLNWEQQSMYSRRKSCDERNLPRRPIFTRELGGILKSWRHHVRPPNQVRWCEGSITMRKHSTVSVKHDESYMREGFRYQPE